MTIGSGGQTTIALVKTTLGDMEGLDCSTTTLDPMFVTLPCAATIVELMLTYQSVPTSDFFGFPGALARPPIIETYNSAGAKVDEKTMLNPAGQPEIVRFEGNDLKKSESILSAARFIYMNSAFSARMLLPPSRPPHSTPTANRLEPLLTRATS